MSFNKSRRRIAGLLSLLTVAGAGLTTGRNFMVSAAVAGNYFDGNNASELEKAVAVTGSEKYLILKKDRRAPWQNNIVASDAVPNGAGNNQRCGQADLINVADQGTEVVFEDKKAGDLFAALKDAMKNQNMHDKYAVMVDMQARLIQNQLTYDNKTGKAQLQADMSPSLVGDGSSVKDKVVYFHYGEKVYATTANILFQAQALTGELLAFGTSDYALAKECPLSAAMLVGVATKGVEDDSGEQGGIEEVTWMKYAYPEDKKLNGNYVLKPSKPEVPYKAPAEGQPEQKAKQAEYTFGNVKAAELLEKIETTGEEKLKGDLGWGGVILVNKANKEFTCQDTLININNAYKSNFTVTRKINRTFSNLESAKIWVDEHRGSLLGIGGLASGVALGALLTAFVIKGNQAFDFASENSGDGNNEYNEEDENRENYDWE